MFGTSKYKDDYDKDNWGYDHSMSIGGASDRRYDDDGYPL